MGTGVGEAMLLGAAVGGGSAAMTGGDPLKGALLGGLTGGVGSGIGGALGGAEAGTLTSTLGSEAATNAALTNTLPVSSSLTTPMATSGLPAGQSFAQASQFANNAATNQALNGAMSQALPLTGNLGISGLEAAGTSPMLSAPSASTAASTAAPAGSSFTQAMQDPTKYIMDNKFKMAAAGMAGAMGSRPDAYMPEEYNGPLKRFRINESLYRPAMFEEGGIATLASGGNAGGISNLGSYSDGGRMLRGPGDGMSDSIPASISGKRPARLADGEFVVPADVVSHLGNGSTDAGAKTLYGMMDKVRSARTGRKSQGREINPNKYMPA